MILKNICKIFKLLIKIEEVNLLIHFYNQENPNKFNNKENYIKIMLMELKSKVIILI